MNEVRGSKSGESGYESNRRE